MPPDPVDQIKAELEPRLNALISNLSDREESLSALFFSNLRNQLSASDSEADLIEFTIELSTCAFLGLDYSQASAVDIDDFLMRTERIAHAMTASSESRQ